MTAQKTGQDRLLRALRVHRDRGIDARPLQAMVGIVSSVSTDTSGFAVEIPEHGFTIDADNLLVGHSVKQFDTDYGLKVGDSLAIHATPGGDWVATDVLSATIATGRGPATQAGTGAPAAGLGTNGDIYYDTASQRLYGPKTGGSWGAGTSLVGPAGAAGAPGAAGAAGAAGATGAAGTNGNTVLNGTGAPGAGIGVNGDFYIDTSSAVKPLYGPKAAGAWPGSPTQLVGPAGSTGLGLDIGAIMTHAGPVNPNSAVWQLCDGSSLLRAGTYAALFAQLAQGLGTFTVTLASPGVFTIASHGLKIGDPVSFSTTGSLPTGITAGATYYVMTVPTGSTFTVGTTRSFNVNGVPTVTTAVNTSGSQSGTHSALFIPYGAVDSAHFNVPDMRGRALVASGPGTGLSARNPGAQGGEETHLLTAAESGLPAHTPTMQSGGAHTHTPGPGGNFAYNIGGGTADFVGGANYAITATTNSAGTHTHTMDAVPSAPAASAHNAMPPYVAMPMYIRYA